MARVQYDYDNNGLARVYLDGGWRLVDKSGKQVSEVYTYIEEWGDGCYKAEQGAKKNILRPDGSLVLKTWHNDVFKVEKGFFLFSNTIRKSKTNPKTRYTYGLAHINGDVIFPMIFDKARWFEDKEAIYAEIDEKPYIISLDGSLYDPAKGHLPKKLNVDLTKCFEDFANWVLPGLQFFYRDTDAPVIVDTTYHVGDILRAGFFVDVTTKLLKPAHKTRFLIASAHAAMFCEVEELCKDNPKLKEWGLCTLHFNSFFKVMDVYEKNGVTQVFLLHIPAAAAFFLGHDETTMNFVNEATGQEATLVDMARKSLDEKLLLGVHPRSLDPVLVDRMKEPVGLDEEYYPVSLNEQDDPSDESISYMSSLVHKLANDADLKNIVKVEDNFPFNGVDGHVCEGCIYAKGIQGHGEGCGRLFIKSFRDRYLKGVCEYRKDALTVPSAFERREALEKKLAKETVEKQCDKFSLDLLKEFVEKRMNGDVKLLKDYDFKDIKTDTRFGNERGVTTEPNETMLMKAILTLVFSEAWPDFTYESMEKHKYKADSINITSSIFGIGYEDYYKSIEQFDVPADLKERAIKFGRKIHTIGNMMVLPFGLQQLRNTKPLGRGYADTFLTEFYKMMAGEKKCSMKLLDAINLKKKDVLTFRTEENFQKIVRKLMLEDFLDENGKPKPVFQGLLSWEMGIDRQTYLNALSEYLDFCEPFVDKRADRIIEKLENILNNR